jgi:PAS domain S-box-containing protein
MAGAMPLEAVRELQRERDHLLLLHEALAEVERAPSLERRLRVFVDAIRRTGFGRVVIALRDAELNATAIVAAGLTEDEERMLHHTSAPGAVWQRRLSSLERFRISHSYYLSALDPWVAEEFGGGLRSTLSPTDDPDWSPQDTLLVPLRNASGAIIATLLLDDPENRARPSLTRVRTVELFAQQAAAMLEQASLVELAQRRAGRLQKLHEVGSVIARSLDESTILRTLARQIESVIAVSSVAVMTIESDGTPLPRVYRHLGREEAYEATPPIPRALAALAAESGQPAAAGGALAVPAILGSAVVAVAVVESHGGEPVDADDADLLLTIGAQAAAAVSNARLYAESQRQRRQTEALADVARAVSESLRLDRVLHLILRHATALLRTDGATISLLRGDSLEVIAGVGAGEAIVGNRLPLVGSMSGRAVRTASSIMIDDVREDPDAFAPSVHAASMRNVILVPLSSVQGPVGVLAVFNRVLPFAADDAEVLHRLADQVAVAVVNARLFEEVAEATREWAVAFDAIGSGMVLLDGAGRIQRSNARARHLIGVSTEEEVLGRDFHGALFGTAAPCAECVHLTAIARGEVTRGAHDDPAKGRVFELTASPHPLGGAIVTFDDVSAHHALAERHRRVVDTSSDAIVITDRARRIVFANPAAFALFGRGDEIIGMTASRTASDDKRSEIHHREDLAFAGEPQRYEGVIARPDGERRIVSISTAPLRELGEVTGIVASLRDVTDERRARDAVVQSESRYRNLFESASDAIYTLDVHGAFTSVNEATCQMSGRTRDVLLGRSSMEFLDPADASAVREHYVSAARGEAVRYECHFVRGDGERRLLSVTNTPIRQGRDVVGLLAVARDVTDERARARALERSEAQYTRLVESASDAIFTVDVQGRFTAVNRSLEHGVGRGREELLGQPFTLLVDARDLAAVDRLLDETFQGERSRGAVRYRAGDGQTRQGSLTTSPIFESNVIVGALGIMRDVTDEQRLADQLLQQEKLAAVGQLVSGVAHELNNPLAGVMAFSQLLLASPAAADPEPRHAMETIHREAKRAAKIVSHLLTFARQQPAERGAADLNALVSDSLELRRYALRAAQVEVETALDPDLPRTWADPLQLQQVVLNLLTNAEQALSGWSGARRIVVRTARDGERLVLTVSDTGPGIFPEQQDRIFNPFYTTKPLGQGTGLGLSISDGIVREHGGRLRVESQPGRGATFVMEIPYIEPLARASGGLDASAVEGEESLRVLVVDDEPAMRAAISGFLGSLGHAVDVAAGGLAARSLIAENEYDAILLDLRMPDMGGEALFRELCACDARHADRVVFVTGDVQGESARRFLAGAGRPVVSKPFQLDDLVTVLATVTL